MLLVGCTARPVLPVAAGGRVGEPAADGRALLARAAREEAALGTRVRFLGDEALDAYLAAVVDRLWPPETRQAGEPAPRIATILDPTIGAFSMPDGRIYLHTGLLAALRNEAEVAAIVGRALAHVVHGDALRVAREGPGRILAHRDVAGRLRQAVQAGAGTVQSDPAGSAVLSPVAAAILGLGLSMAGRASMEGYPRRLEGRADEEALQRLARAGYDPRQAAGVFGRLEQECRGRGPMEMFLLGRPAYLRARAARFRTLLRRSGPEPARPDPAGQAGPGGDLFEVRTRVAVRENAALDARAGRFDLARRQLDRVLASSPDDPLAQLYHGDLDRLEAQRAATGTERDALAARALRRYERAASLAPALAEPYRGLGLLHFQQGETDRAREAFLRYLTLRPDAPDAARIREYVLDLGR